MRIGQLLIAVDAGEPMSGRLLVRIDVVHSRCVPTVATAFENRNGKLDFGITIFRQLRDLKRPHTRSVVRRAVLGEAKQAIIKLQDPPRWSRATLVVPDQRALWMLGPLAGQFRSKVKPHCVVPVRRGTGE